MPRKRSHQFGQLAGAVNARTTGQGAIRLHGALWRNCAIILWLEARWLAHPCSSVSCLSDCCPRQAPLRAPLRRARLRSHPLRFKPPTAEPDDPPGGPRHACSATSAPTWTDRRIKDEIARFLCGVALRAAREDFAECGARWLDSTVVSCLNRSRCGTESSAIRKGIETLSKERTLYTARPSTITHTLPHP